MARFITIVSLLLTIGAKSAVAQSAEAQHARQLVRKVTPLYPDLARRNHLSGAVRFRATVAANGAVKAMELLGGNPVFVRASQDAISSWKYAPANSETQETIELVFDLP